MCIFLLILKMLFLLNQCIQNRFLAVTFFLRRITDCVNCWTNFREKQLIKKIKTFSKLVLTLGLSRCNCCNIQILCKKMDCLKSKVYTNLPMLLINSTKDKALNPVQDLCDKWVQRHTYNIGQIYNLSYFLYKSV